MTATPVAERVAEVRERDRAAAARAPGATRPTVTLVARDEDGRPSSASARRVAAGVTDVGENRAQELLGEGAELAATAPRWHFLGQLQRNKVRALAPWVACWQSVDRAALGAAIARRAPGRPGARRGEPRRASPRRAGARPARRRGARRRAPRRSASTSRAS